MMASALGKCWVDALSVLLSIIYYIVLYRRRSVPLPVIAIHTGGILTEGLAIAPLLLLLPAAFVPSILLAVMESSRLTLVVAGVYGALAIVAPRWNHPALLETTD